MFSIMALLFRWRSGMRAELDENNVGSSNGLYICDCRNNKLGQVVNANVLSLPMRINVSLVCNYELRVWLYPAIC